MASPKKNKPEQRNQSREADGSFGAPVVVPIEDSIDLHAFSSRDIPSVVTEYLEQCRLKGFYEVRLIHGRGKGVQRRIIRSLLEKHPMVLSLKDAPPEAGGWGATVAVLKR